MSTPTPTLTPHHPSPNCPSALTSAVLQLHYLAEGAANVIYSVSVLSPPALQHHSHCCVLRLRKDLPSTKPAIEVMRDFQERIAPLFSGHEDLLMKQALYQLTPEMLHNANAELREMEAEAEADAAETPKRDTARHHHRRHVYLPAYETEHNGIVMQNLKAPGVEQLVEFKPKWLVQSPSAPGDAKNCRTCALNAMRRKGGTHQGRGDSGFCPLDLLSEPDEGQVLPRALAKLSQQAGGRIDEEDEKAFVACFRQRVQPALRHLATLQRRYGSVGLEDYRSPAGKDLDLAMALRDCSVFLALRTATDSGQSADRGRVELVDVKFADLDLKTAEGGKIQKWASTEEELLEGGWYYTAEGTNCSLSRHRRNRREK